MRVVSLPGGRHRFIYSPEELDVRVDDSVLKCVAFVGKVLHFDGTSFDGDPLGTGFFVSMRSSIAGKMFHYFVTAKHVLDGLDGERWYLWINHRDGSRITFLPDDKVRWWFHPSDNTDVAVFPFPVHPQMDIVSVPTADLFLTPENIEKYRIGVGDEVFITGLFTFAQGRERNVPMVRTGNIAMIPDGPVQTVDGDMDVYLIEARSIGGLSGSPVFVRETIPLRVKEDKSGENVIMTGLGRLQLLGLCRGHWKIRPEDLNVISPVTGSGVNMGIGLVIPAMKILETLNHPELIEMRRRAEEEEEKSKGPRETLDSASGNYERFGELAGRVLSVPKSEIDRREANFKAERKNRPRVGPKPKR